MELSYKNVRILLQERGMEYPNLNIFRQRGTVNKIAQWQPKANICFQRKIGFYSNDENYFCKAESFMDFAQEENADIIVTPEYSFPWKLLEKILFTENDIINYGKLCCLGMEGIAFSEFRLFLNKCKENKDIEIIIEDINNISKKDFLSCLVYLFIASGRKVCLVQLKTTAASDKWVQLESGGLTTGNVIYFFDDKEGGELFNFNNMCRCIKSV